MYLEKGAYSNDAGDDDFNDWGVLFITFFVNSQYLQSEASHTLDSLIKRLYSTVSSTVQNETTY